MHRPGNAEVDRHPVLRIGRSFTRPTVRRRTMIPVVAVDELADRGIGTRKRCRNLGIVKTIVVDGVVDEGKIRQGSRLTHKRSRRRLVSATLQLFSATWQLGPTRQLGRE